MFFLPDVKKQGCGLLDRSQCWVRSREDMLRLRADENTCWWEDERVGHVCLFESRCEIQNNVQYCDTTLMSNEQIISKSSIWPKCQSLLLKDSHAFGVLGVISAKKINTVGLCCQILCCRSFIKYVFYMWWEVGHQSSPSICSNFGTQCGPAICPNPLLPNHSLVH